MPIEPQIQYATTDDDVRIGFCTFGHGPPLVLAPGEPLMDIYPDVQVFEGTRPRTVQTREQGLRLLGRLLFVEPDMEQDRSLQDAIGELMVETPAGLTINGAAPGYQALISWSPN